MTATGRTIHQPKAIIGAAEALQDFQRTIIRKAFDCPSYNTYGCREFMLIASECENHTLHRNIDHLVVELRKPESYPDDSKTGEVIVTDLFNYGMPFIRYLNGDMATASDTPCSCGRGLATLASVDGRILDTIRTPDGRVLAGQFFPFMLKDVKGLQRFQVVQRQLDRLDLSIVRGA